MQIKEVKKLFLKIYYIAQTMEYWKGCDKDRLTVTAKPTYTVDTGIPRKINPN